MTYKAGRNKNKCERYVSMNVRIINKIRRLKKHIIKNTNDDLAIKSLKTLWV